MSLFGGCCGFGGDMPSLAEKADSTKYSAILSLDSYVQDWAYASVKDAHEATTSCFSCEKFPKQKDLDIIVHWDWVTFTHNAPEELKSPSRRTSAVTPAAPDSNGHESIALVPPSGPQGGFDPRNKMDSLHQETFSVKFDNTTDETCETTLSSARTVKASYEVDVHQSVQTGHSLQLSLEVGGEDAPAKLGASYEFNKMLEDYKGEKRVEEMETALNTECPVKVKGKHTTEAKFVTTYQNYKKTLHVTSTFHGDLNVSVVGKKKGKNGKKFFRKINNDVGKVFNKIKKQGDSLLTDMISIDDDLVVSYTSSATFCSSFGVDQHVILNSQPHSPS